MFLKISIALSTLSGKKMLTINTDAIKTNNIITMANMPDSILVAKFIPLFSCDFGALILGGGDHRALNANCLRSYLRVRSVSCAFIVAFSLSTYASFQFLSTT
jgi:hypothetical protein